MFHIRKATKDDILKIDVIARQFPNALGWVRKVSLEKAIEKGYLNVAQLNETGLIIGFVEYNIPTRGSNIGYSVIYHLAVDINYQSLGVGKYLIYSVPTPIRLKVKRDNIKARMFYVNNWFTEIPCRLENLVQYQRNSHFIWIQGTRKLYWELCKKHNILYGSRNTELPVKNKHHIMFGALDYNWKLGEEQWNKYLQQIQKYKPLYAVVKDFEALYQISSVLKKIKQLKELGVLYPIVPIKFNGAVRYLPKEVLIGLSIPSKHSGFLPEDFNELQHRRIHLLGGTPIKLKKIIPKLLDVNVIIQSWDANYFERSASYGKIWDDNKYVQFEKPVNRNKFMEISLINSVKTLNNLVRND